MDHLMKIRVRGEPLLRPAIGHDHRHPGMEAAQLPRCLLSQDGEGRPFSTCVPVYPGAALGCEGGNTQGEKIQGDQIIFPFVSE